MKRRKFVKTSILAATSPALFNCSQSNTKPFSKGHVKKKIKGFIFSDAHIGWANSNQPSKELQKKAINTISDRFGDLDLVFDTGDVYHGNLLENQKVDASGFWLEHMAGKFPTSLFHYIPGNHELARGTTDVEVAVGQLGSFVLRPYYSFDFKGVHFISLPQLQDTILITQETLNWLKVDIEKNKDKTTLVFSHNSIEGTTSDFNSTVYRVTANSDEVLEVLNKHNNVVAWFHGHNHQYEIVKKEQRLYVSNGRIGGFNPPKGDVDFGQGHLGGVYFEIGASGLIVKCFSATKNDFFENLGMLHLSNNLDFRTSLNLRAPVNYYWGHGMIHGNNIYQFHNHYLTQEKSQVHISSNGSRVINTNSDFKFNTEYSHKSGTRYKAMGYHIHPKTVKFKKTPEGLQITPSKEGPFYINFPVEKYKFNNYLSRSGYYRCGLGSSYKLKIKTDMAQNTVMRVKYKIMDRNHKVCYQSNVWQDGFYKEGESSYELNVPYELDQQAADYKIYMFVKVRIDNASASILINNINLYPKPLNELANSKISISGKRIKISEKPSKFEIESESGYIELNDIDSPKTLYVKFNKVDWQIRNATATMINNVLFIQKLRHRYTDKTQIIITPTNNQQFYVNELINCSSCQISYTRNSILIESIDNRSDAIFVIVANTPPVKAKGVRLTQNKGLRYIYQIINDRVLISY